MMLFCRKLTIFVHAYRNYSSPNVALFVETPVYLNDRIMDVSVAELYVPLSSRCWSNRLPGQDFPDVLSDTQHRLSGTRCHKQFSSAIIRLFLNLDLKLSYSLRLSLNTGPTCHQRR